MLVDARTLPDGAIVEADLCIVGAGSAATAIATRLAGTGIRICLLESGGLEVAPETQALAKGASTGLRYSDLETCQLRCLGGNANAWGGWFSPLDEIDFQRRSWVEASGWPLSSAELAPYYRWAHELCEVPQADHDLAKAVEAIGSPRARPIPFDRARLETALYRFSPPTRFGRKYRALIEKSPEIHCLTHATVLGIRSTSDARQVTGVSVGCLSGRRLEARAMTFVLAAGAIENARLLLLSSELAASGLGNRHDLVGRYFMDHPHTRRVLIRGPKPIPLGLYGMSFRKHGIAAGIALPPSLQEKERLLNYRASIYPVYASQASSGWRTFRNLALSLSSRWSSDPYDRCALPFAPKRPSARQILRMAGQVDRVAAAALIELVKPDRLASGLVLESKPEQAPDPHSRITLGGECDAFGRRRATVHWRLSSVNQRTARRAEEIIDQELRRLGIGLLAPLGPEERDWVAGCVGGWHQIGTTRAHEDPRQGVVDQNLRVHGISNLFVAGASVFPTGGAVSPMPTILALAARLADHLKTVLPACDPPRIAKLREYA